MIMVRQNMAALRYNAVSLSGQIANSANNLLAKLIFEIAFATRFQQHPFGATERSSSSEELMVAKAPGDPPSRAAEFAESIRLIASDRSEAAFDLLFRHFAPRIKSYCLRLGCDASAAEEITQDAMVAIWRNAAQFDPSKASPSTWIFAIARNLSIDRFRKNRRPQFDPDDPALVPDHEVPPDLLLERANTEQGLRKIMESLSANERSVLLLSFFENLSHSEIAKRLDIPIGTVKSRIRLAFGKIRSALDKQDRTSRS